MKKNLYRLHRTLSIIIAIPVLLWASSGFMHPIMTNIRPAIATQGILPVAIDSQWIHFPLATALHQHHIDSFSNFRLVHIDTNWFYQVQPTGAGAVPIYVSCTNGNILTAGDWLYAQYLARQFLEGPAIPRSAAPSADPSVTPAAARSTPSNFALPASMPAHEIHDCCGAATDIVLNPTRGAKVANVSMLHTYDNEYKNINRLLPVYRVSFDRPDGIRIYVETTQDRFSFAMDDRRAIFDEIFRLCHTWGWLDFLGKGRLAVEVLVALTALLTAILGIYLFFTTRGSRSKDNPLVKSRRNHRYTAIVASLFTLLWTFSGSYHAFSKFTDDVRDQYSINNHFAADLANCDLTRLQTACSRPVTNLSLVSIKGTSYWRATLLPDKISTHKDLMKDMRAALPPISYLRTDDYTVLADGDKRYACWMATRFSGYTDSMIRKVEPVTAFGDEYNFTDKRLPVWKVSYNEDGHRRYYVETSSGRLASRVDDRVAAEGYSFSVFHKHHFMDWGGKTARDASTMVWAFVQVLMVTVGLILWFKRRSARPSPGRPIIRS